MEKKPTKSSMSIAHVAKAQKPASAKKGDMHRDIIEPGADKKSRSGFPSLLDRLTIRLSHADRLMFTKYLSVLLHSGLAMDDALSIIADQSRRGPLKKIVATLLQDVRGGETLASGFAKFPQVFSSIYINLVGAGEASGTLQDNLGHLAEQIQKEHTLRQKVRGALMYPAVILVGAVVLSIGIVVFILPNITDVFRTLNVELPWTTRALLWLAELFEQHGGLVALGFVLLIVAIAVVRKIKPIQPALHRVWLMVPVVGTIMRNTNLARFARVTGTMLKSGSTISDILPIATSVLKNARYRFLLAQMAQEVHRGRSLASFMQIHRREFSEITVHMTRVGEESGALGEMMTYVAEFYEQEIDDTMRNLSNLLEPVLLVVIGVLVGTLALSIISPIYQVVGKI